MKKKETRGRSQDRAKVAANQEHEVNYETDKMNISPEVLKKAVKSAGNQRTKVEKQVKKAK